MINEETPSVIVKRKNIQGLIDYCLENKVEFKIKPRVSNSEEFEFDFNISSIKKAIALGMCLRELRLELTGTPVAAAVNKPAKKQVSKENGHSKEELVTPVSFANEESFQLDLEAAN
jgi:hypothetical protein